MSLKQLSSQSTNVLVIAVTLLSLVRCAGVGPVAPSNKSSAKSSGGAVGKIIGESGNDSDEPIEDEEVNHIQKIENARIDDVIRVEEPNTQTLYDDSRYDFPIIVNSRVEGWIDYFTGRGRDHMERYLSRGGRYIPVMKQILKKSGLPEDLVYLALIESGFNTRAKSRAKAVGPWQFMKATGQRYGLRVNAWIDERRDPIRSTQAAARYLKDLYLMFESWYLAASAYNAGEYKILRAIENTKTNNFWRISETKQIRRETKDYIPKLISAAIIAKNPAKYGFEDLDYLEPLEFETVSVQEPLKLSEVAQWLDTPVDEIEDLNPELRRGVVPPEHVPYDLKVPVGSRVLVERALASIKPSIKKNEFPAQYTVRKGDTLASLAKKFRVTRASLMSTNDLGSREKLSPGTQILIPNQKPRALAAQETSKKKASAENTGDNSEADPEGFIFHTVKSGESLWSISEKYNVTVQELFKWNRLSRSRIFPGKRIRVKHHATSES